MRFPNIPEIREQWVRRVDKPNFTPNGASRLCSHHFHPSCYKVSGRLKPGAIPTLFNVLEHDAEVSNFDF